MRALAHTAAPCPDVPDGIAEALLSGMPIRARWAVCAGPSERSLLGPSPRKPPLVRRGRGRAIGVAGRLARTGRPAVARQHDQVWKPLWRFGRVAIRFSRGLEYRRCAGARRRAGVGSSRMGHSREASVWQNERRCVLRWIGTGLARGAWPRPRETAGFQGQKRKEEA